MLAHIPIVEIEDIRKLDLRAVETLGSAFHDIGFVLVRAPEISQLLFSAYGESRKLFALPMEDKAKDAHPEIFYQRGWTPPFTEHGIFCKSMNLPADAKENWFIGPEQNSVSKDLIEKYPEMYPRNIWPDKVPGFKPAMQILYDFLYACGLDVLRAVAVYMKTDGNLFDEMTFNSPTVLRAIHYPAIRSQDVGNIVWGCRHTDINLLTILPASTREGLYIKRRGGVWISGHSSIQNFPGFLAQVGDMLQYLTAGKFLSAWHEVRAPQYVTTEGRESFAHFIHAGSGVLFEPGDKRYPPITAGEYLMKRLKEIGLA